MTGNVFPRRSRTQKGHVDGAEQVEARKAHPSRVALGGAAAKATAGFLCGPGAPVCVTILFVSRGLAEVKRGHAPANLLAKAPPTERFNP